MERIKNIINKINIFFTTAVVVLAGLIIIGEIKQKERERKIRKKYKINKLSFLFFNWTNYVERENPLTNKELNELEK